MAAAAAVPSRIHPTLPERDNDDDAAGCPLLDLRCHVGDLPNSTTATGVTSNQLPNKLDLLPNPHPSLFYSLTAALFAQAAAGTPPQPRIFDDLSTALLSHADGSYAVACLTTRMMPEFDAKTCLVTSVDFDVHLYRSSSSAAEGRWVTMTLPVRDPVRETLTPVPKDVLEEMLYHDTGKPVAVGGAVVWADLWRGLIVCDGVLDEQPELRDVPLPLPTRSNRRYLFRKGPPDLLRDVAVSRHKDCIKYVEVELERRGGGGDSGRWKKATVYSMPIPVGSWEDWSVDCEVHVEDIAVDVDNPMHSRLLSQLWGRDTTSKLQELAYPTISMDDDVVFVFSETRNSRKDNKLGVVVAVDVRNKALRGVTELNLDVGYIWQMPLYCATEIGRCLKKITAVHLMGTQALITGTESALCLIC
ncbi:hypothetical protein QOZ80_2BG0191870 [Eleusine coracana subsp. coracana]|nr:hypothetical protein QOZ80_2BG0191870 [Eleusine coracana subsp. coracana]